MDAERWQRAEQLFEEALQLPDADRSAFVRHACGDDAALHDELVQMLSAEAAGALAIERRLDAHRAATAPLPGGGRIGPYRILDLLGRGGMGVVWRAVQEEPVEREVALKVLAADVDGGELLRRFEMERQVLARLDHPHIARLYDAGATVEGRPYFVMERVRGAPITRYCDEHRLGVRERIELFLQVCDAVQHAHQRGILHRDLKPSNLLVATGDGQPRPKVIDFGIAKGLETAIDPLGEVTRTGRAPGTPVYMSPEHADPSLGGVDIRSDVYSLGVVLYRLLVGALPHEPDADSREALSRPTRDRSVPRPSARLAALGGTQLTVARDRATTLPELRRRLRGELDWVLLRALESDRERRYPTVERFAADLRRYLSHLPVEAGPPSTVYRARTFVRRHRWGVASVTAIVLALGTGSALAFAGERTARRAEAEARAEAEEALRIRDFLIDVFSVNDPGEARGRTVTARELLARGAERIRFDLEDRPGLQADLMGALGSAYAALGLLEPADSLLQGALERRALDPARDAVDQAASLRDMGLLRQRQGRWEEAFALLAAAERTLDSAAVTDPAARARLQAALGTVQTLRGELDDAQRRTEAALSLWRQMPEPDARGVVQAIRWLGVIQNHRDDPQASLAFLRDAVAEAARAFGPEHPFTLDTQESLALSLSNAGEGDSALALHHRVLEGRSRVFSPDHPTLAYSYHNLGRELSGLGRHEEAIPLLRRSVELRERALGPDDPTVGFALETLGIATAMKGDLAGTEPLFLRALSIYEARLGPAHPETLEALLNVAELEWYLDRPEAAWRRFAEAVERGTDQIARVEGPPFRAWAGERRYEDALERVRAIAAGR